jgi:hypothetical protein
MSLRSCPECENQVSTRARFCPKCGFPFDQALNESSGRRAPSRRSIRPLWVAICCIGFFLLSSRFTTNPFLLHHPLNPTSLVSYQESGQWFHLLNYPLMLQVFGFLLFGTGVIQLIFGSRGVASNETKNRFKPRIY